jgi:1-acyl-sn-glycerol-3-phosphate acyltransferase
MSLYTTHQPGAGVLSDLFALYVRLYVRPHVTGKEYLPTTGAWILAANHASHADTAVIYAAIPHALRRRLLAAAAQDYFFVGGLRQQFARTLYNAIPVDRDSSRSGDPLRHVVRALREGYGVLIYPEGTRSLDGSIGRFRPGIGRLIARFPSVPVIPTLLGGTDLVLPKGRALPSPHRVNVTFGSPLYLQADPEDRATWQQAADQVRAAIIALEPPAEPSAQDPDAAEPAEDTST